MNIAAAIKRHEHRADFYARHGKAKAARLELIRIAQLRTLAKIRAEVREMDDCTEVYK